MLWLSKEYFSVSTKHEEKNSNIGLDSSLIRLLNMFIMDAWPLVSLTSATQWLFPHSIWIPPAFRDITKGNPGSLHTRETSCSTQSHERKGRSKFHWIHKWENTGKFMEDGMTTNHAYERSQIVFPFIRRSHANPFFLNRIFFPLSHLLHISS